MSKLCTVVCISLSHGVIQAFVHHPRCPCCCTCRTEIGKDKGDMWTDLRVDLIPLQLSDRTVYVHAGFLAAAQETFPEVCCLPACRSACLPAWCSPQFQA